MNNHTERLISTVHRLQPIIVRCIPLLQSYRHFEMPSRLFSDL